MGKIKSEQIDIEETDTVDTIDTAIMRVRQFQAGTAKLTHVRVALAGLDRDGMVAVSIGTRVNLKSLEALKGS